MLINFKIGQINKFLKKLKIVFKTSMLWKISLKGLEIILCKGEMGNATCDIFLDPKSIKFF